MPVEQAARIHDTIGHSCDFFGQVVGFGAGLALGVALVVAGVIAAPFTAGVSLLASIGAIIAILGLGETFGSIGGLIGQMIPMTTGMIIKGARTVFIGPGRKNAARVRDLIECKDPGVTILEVAGMFNSTTAALAAIYGATIGSHAGAEIKTGSQTVKIEGQQASRRGETTTCGGKITSGSKTVLIGGPVYSTGIGSGKEVPAWWEWLNWLIKWANFFRDVKQFAQWGWKFAPQAYRILKNIPGARKYLRAAELLGKKLFWGKGITGKLRFLDWYDPLSTPAEEAVKRIYGEESAIYQNYKTMNDILGGVKELKDVKEKDVVPKLIKKLSKVD